jgi:hypothetical protein
MKAMTPSLLMMLVLLPSQPAILMLATMTSEAQALMLTRRLLLVLGTTFLILSSQTTLSFLVRSPLKDVSTFCGSTNSRHRRFETKFFCY